MIKNKEVEITYDPEWDEERLAKCFSYLLTWDMKKVIGIDIKVDKDTWEQLRPEQYKADSDIFYVRQPGHYRIWYQEREQPIAQPKQAPTDKGYAEYEKLIDEWWRNISIMGTKKLKQEEPSLFPIALLALGGLFLSALSQSTNQPKESQEPINEPIHSI